jgi:hypothetical protein
LPPGNWICAAAKFASAKQLAMIASIARAALPAARKFERARA